MLTRHLIDLSDLSIAEWEEITRLACDIREHMDDYYGVCRGKILATLFYEPSTRTQMSFQTAMLRIGGYADIIAMRHPVAGAAKAASLFSRVPVINAGDGGHLHPTQTLTDLVTLRHEKERFSGLCIGLCGDLRNGRTVHSLINALSRYAGIRFVLISPEVLRLPAYVRQDVLEQKQIPYKETTALETVLPELDIL